MKITTWNVNQFYGNESWKAVKELLVFKDFVKMTILECIKEKILNKIESFLQNENDLLFLNEVPIKKLNNGNEFSDEIRNWCEKRQLKIIETDINRESKYFKTIAICKDSSGYDYAFKDYKDYNERIKKAFGLYDSTRVVALKDNNNNIFIGAHFNSSKLEVFVNKLKEFIKEIKKEYKNCRIVCCGDINIYEKNTDILDKYEKETELNDAWTKDNKFQNDDLKGMTSSYAKDDKKGKKRIDRIFIYNSIKKDEYDLLIDDKNVEDIGYDIEHKNFIVDEKLGLELSDHYPLSIVFREAIKNR